jgi:hypothetical protein
MQLALFTKLRVYVNGTLLFRESSVKASFHSGLIPTFDVNSGFAGVTQGAGFVTATVEQIVPAGGPVLLVEGFMNNAQVVTISLLTNSGSSFTSDGFCMNSDIQHGTNSETKYSFEFQGETGEWLVVPAV